MHYREAGSGVTASLIKIWTCYLVAFLNKACFTIKSRLYKVCLSFNLLGLVMYSKFKFHGTTALFFDVVFWAIIWRRYQHHLWYVKQFKPVIWQFHLSVFSLYQGSLIGWIFPNRKQSTNVIPEPFSATGVVPKPCPQKVKSSPP